MTDIQARWDIGLLNDQCQIFKQKTDGNILKLDLDVYSDDEFKVLKSSHAFPISNSFVEYHIKNREVSKGRVIAGPCDFDLALTIPKSLFDKALFSLENKVFTFLLFNWLFI